MDTGQSVGRAGGRAARQVRCAHAPWDAVPGYMMARCPSSPYFCAHVAHCSRGRSVPGECQGTAPA